jgi:Na+/melibiose symporter-like transporter
VGLVIALIGTQLTKEAEMNESEPQEEKKGFWYNVKNNFSQIGMALQMPEIYLVICFFVLNGLFSPSFGQFSYFFMLNVAGITKFQYAMFGVISKVCHILGTMYYKAYLKDTETRTVIYYSTIMCVFSTGLKFCYASRWNLLIGISDVMFLVFTDIVFGCLVLAMNILPCLALFAKITPPGIEGTVFAFLTGTWNMADSVISPMVGAKINE